MYCSKCKNKVRDNALFCGNCGSHFIEKKVKAPIEAKKEIKNETTEEPDGALVKYNSHIKLVLFLYILSYAAEILIIWNKGLQLLGEIANVLLKNIENYFFYKGRWIGIANLRDTQRLFSLERMSIDARALLYILLALTILRAVLLFAALWRMFKKAGMGGWKLLIPFYNGICFYRMARGSGWWILFDLAALVTGGLLFPKYVIWLQLLLVIITVFSLSWNFGHGVGYAIGLLFLPRLFMLVIGWGKSKFVFDKTKRVTTGKIVGEIITIACLIAIGFGIYRGGEQIGMALQDFAAHNGMIEEFVTSMQEGIPSTPSTQTPSLPTTPTSDTQPQTSAPSSENTAATHYLEVTGDRVNLRKEPTADSDSLTKLSTGTKCIDLGSRSEDGMWYEVITADGLYRGWVNKEYLK